MGIGSSSADPEKMPFLRLAALSCIVTFVVQQKGRSGCYRIEVFPPGVRIANAFVSYIIYIGKTIWPDNLAVFYPHPGLLPFWQVLGAVLLLIAVTLTVIRTAKRFPLPGGGMAVVCGYACARHRDCAGRRSSHGRPLYLCPPDRLVRHGGMGHSGTR